MGRPLSISATRLSNGSMPTSLLKLRNSMTSKRRLSQSATQSLPSCTKALEVCQAACLTWEVWVVVCLVLVELPALELVVPDLPLRKLTNRLARLVQDGDNLETFGILATTAFLKHYVRRP